MSSGLVPVIQHLKYNGQLLGALEEFDKFKDLGFGRCYVEASIHRTSSLLELL